MDFPYVVVDGSNIATEARSLPSLQQLDEAVRAFLEQHKVEQLTVIVDATFGHRIDPSESEEFDAAVANAEIITPPAGTVGRGDAFILQVAERAGATILSNDSFQEFHGTYTWLFDEARLMGGKPVPGIGWVFTARTPVRGAISRRATREAKQPSGAARKRGGGRTERSTDRPSTPAPKAARSTQPSRSKEQPKDQAATDAGSRRRRRGKRTTNDEPLNELLPFLDFLGSNPPGSEVEAVVASYASHGAYILVGELRGYVPLKAMGEPTPLRARDVLALGDVHRFRVESIDTPRRGVDLSLVLDEAGQPLPRVGTADLPEPASDLAVESEGEPAAEVATAGVPRARRRRSAKATPALDDAVTTYEAESPAEEAPVSPVKKATTKKAAKKAPAKKAAPKKAAKKAPAKKAAPKKAAKKAPARKAPARKAPAKKAAPKKAAKKAPARKAPAKKAPAKKAAPKKAAKKAPARKAPARKAPAKKAAPKKAAKKAPARRR